MLKQQLETDLKHLIASLGFQVNDIVFRDSSRKSIDIDLSIPKNSQFGDYTSNMALQLSNQEVGGRKQNPLEIANEISKQIKTDPHISEYLEKAEVAGPGFINFYFKTDSLMKNLHKVCDYSYFVDPGQKSQESGVKSQDQKILLEYAQPNTHKAFHIGHTRNITLGESVARLLESQGNEVYRCTYGSDIGLPVAKAIWGVLHLTDEYKLARKQSSKEAIKQRAEFLGKAYALGATTYEEKEDVKQEIDEINKQIYQKNPKYLSLWEETRQWSLDYLNLVYAKLGTKFNGVFVESQVEGEGQKIVLKNVGNVFEADAGAIIFPGEKYGLHNRVFITAAGNPTYEGKEIGLAKLEYDSFNYDKAIHIVDVQQEGYFQVVIKVIDMLFPELTGKKYHLSYGYVDLLGRKMSSRTGDVVTFDYLYDEVRRKVAKIMNSVVIPAEAGIQVENKSSGSRVKPGMTDSEKDSVIDMISIGAIKFTMLKYSPQTKIMFDLEKSVALDGDSGPYLQYTYARAKSVLRSASYDYQPEITPGDLEKEERLLLQKIELFSGIVKESAKNFSPTVLATFLLEVARDFNLFYQKHQIIKASEHKAEFRLALTCAIAVILKQGLYLLGIEAPERM